MIWIILLLALLPAPTTFALFSKVQDIDSAQIKRVVIAHMEPSLMAAGSRNTLYMSRDGGASFQKAAGVTDEQIRDLFIDESQPATLYMAADRHAYKISEGKIRIFTARENESIQAIAKHQSRLFIATSAGLYYADEPLLNWNPVPGLRNQSVYSVEPAGDNLYLACERGAYLLSPDGNLSRLFVTRSDHEDNGLKPQFLKPDRHIPDRLWLGTNKGLFYSTDHGDTWQKLYVSGADHVSVHFLAQPKEPVSLIYICTDAGLFQVDTRHNDARPLFEGVSSSEAWSMDFTDDGSIYLATSQGLFTDAMRPQTHPSAPINMETLLTDEPSIQEIQTAAMRYNSVHPDKVDHWRRRLKYRALFPKLRVDYDRSLTTYQGQFIAGPNDWGVSLSWDIGDLIWNTYEDDIDNRNKLTTQLRIDILDEINRIYFERLRLKQAITTDAPGSQERLQDQLRLRELTATLDGYTGGRLSRRLNH